MINPQGCSGVTITEDQTATLVAQDHGHHPAVLEAAGFSTEHSAQSRSIGYEEEKSPTLRAGVVPAALALDNHPTDSRVKIAEDGKVQTLTERMGTGGGNVTLVAEPEPVTLKIRGGRPGGGKGILCQHDKSATLGTHNDQTLFQPSYGISKEAYAGGKKANYNFAVNEELAPTLQTSLPGAVAKPESLAFGVCSKQSHAMLSDNPKTGFYEANTSRTLDQGGGNPTCNQGGICILSPVSQETYDVRFTSEGTKNARGHCYKTDISRCLDTSEANPDSNHGGVCVLEKDATYCATTGSFMTVEKEKSHTLMARDYKDPQIINDTPNDELMYIVRRLTPTECARLQGFPDWWCAELENPEPTDEEITFWLDVWETWNTLNGKQPKTEKQVRRWLANPYTDAAEYKLWGNGISLPIVYFVLSGIVWAAEKEK